MLVDCAPLWCCRHGFKLDHFERKRKKEARAPHELANYERKAFGLKAKLHHKKRHLEKVRVCVCIYIERIAREHAECWFHSCLLTGSARGTIEC